MKKQVYNPFLPLDVYIPDGEPHVFGDRVYLFGSQDKEGGNTFCMLDYEIWSAPISDLTNWTSNGANYSATQDPLSKPTNRPYMYAPDCVKGNDGKYYLYYCLSGEKGHGGYFGPISVARCDTPDGKYKFYGHVKDESGKVLSQYVQFDPAVINDDGTIRLYYGTWYPFEELPFFLRPIMRKVESKMFNKSIKEIKQNNGVMGAVACVLNDDMLTVKVPPKTILPTKTKGTKFESHFAIPIFSAGQGMVGHGFFEASSIRKINNLYYFIYSSQNNHELCYATSKYPDRDFVYRGVIVSNGDVGYNGRKPKDRLNLTGTNHGSIENINGNWYVFYHRQTHGTDYSRQACAEQIEIETDGSIKQVEITSCGLNAKPLKGVGQYPSVICCNLTNGKMPHSANKKVKNLPMVTSSENERYLANLTNGTIAVYKYFKLSGKTNLIVTTRGKATGKIIVYADDKKIGEIEINKTSNWVTSKTEIDFTGVTALGFQYVGKGKIDFLQFELNK